MTKTKIKYGLLAVGFFIATNAMKADDNDSIPFSGNNILYFKDPRVDVLQKMYMRNATKQNTIRVQVFQAATREKIFEAKEQFSARFPGIVTFVTYAPPNFRLRAGDFDSQTEAFKFLQQVKPVFPASFVIEEKGKTDDSKPKSAKN